MLAVKAHFVSIQFLCLIDNILLIVSSLIGAMMRFSTRQQPGLSGHHWNGHVSDNIRNIRRKKCSGGWEFLCRFTPGIMQMFLNCSQFLGVRIFGLQWFLVAPGDSWVTLLSGSVTVLADSHRPGHISHFTDLRPVWGGEMHSVKVKH